MANKSPTKSWKKGQSGNPKGRPISILRKESLNKVLNAGSNEIDGIITSVIDQAKGGNIQAAKLLFDHLLPNPDANFEEDIMDNLTEEENLKLYDYISSLIPEDEVQKFIDTAKKVTNFVKEMKARRLN